MSLMGPQTAQAPQEQYIPEQMEQPQAQMNVPEQSYIQDIPTLANAVPDMSAQQDQSAYMPETYGDMGFGGGEEFKQGGIASLRRYL